METCSGHQKPRHHGIQINKYNTSSINNKAKYGTNLYDSYPRDSERKRLPNNKIPLPNIKYNNHIDKPKKLIPYQDLYNKGKKEIKTNFGEIKPRKPTTNPTNGHNNINIKKKNIQRNPSNAVNYRNELNKNDDFNQKKNTEKNQNNISTIRVGNNYMQPTLRPESSNEEHKIKIPNRNVSEINKPNIKNNFLQKLNKVEKYINGAIGLSNIGNTCFFNSAIQNLKNIYPFTLYLLKNYHKFDINGFTYKFCELIANLVNQDIYQWFEPKDFFYKLNEMAPIFRFGKQNDSNFCILYILTLLEKEARTYIGEKQFEKKIISNNSFSIEEKNQFSIFMNKMYEKRNSYIMDIFFGFQEDIYKCNNCSYVTFNYQGFSVLNIPIMKRNNTPINNLIDGIEYFQEMQQHYNENGFSCQKCHGYNISTQSRIIFYPKTFIINFKRVGENNFYYHDVKIPPTFKVKNLIDGEIYEYALTGFIKHYGGENSGHNIAICKNFFDSNWYEYDDSRVSNIFNTFNIRNNKIDTSGGFLFVYVRNNIYMNENEINSIKELSKKLRK